MYLNFAKCADAQIHIAIVEHNVRRGKRENHTAAAAAAIWRVQRRNLPQFSKGVKGQNIGVDADELL